ncbi:hypothetical protein EVAR_54811_1 [Eumeta japonica]|uniref:Nucleic-acid-binding protein from transposon X-element n=1 Tax=Eumeta variegata TaxID=151549 RepID=A0A4C1Y3H5_EUMVA|nr:hypothetical protein EVAR_54811_1 [Eumeta japonica]
MSYILLEGRARISCRPSRSTKGTTDRKGQRRPHHPKPPSSIERRITNCTREPLDLVLVTANTTSIDKATKRMFYNVKTECSLTRIKVEQHHKKSIQGQFFNCQLYGHSSIICYQRVRCVKCLGDHGTTACTRNKDTDGPPAYVKVPSNRATPSTRAVMDNLSYATTSAGSHKDPPTNNAPNTSSSEDTKP